MKRDDARQDGMSGRPAGRESDKVTRRRLLQSIGLAGAAAALPEGVSAEPAPPRAAAPNNPLGPGAVPITLNVNGREVRVEVEPRVTLLDALRDHRLAGTPEPVDVTGPKKICDRGACGGCTVILDGRTVYACSILAVEARGREIRTVEGLAKGGALHPLQEEFINCDGLMCGFCTPGFVVSGAALLEKNPKPTRSEIRRALDGNICRCGTQMRALEAVEKAARRR